MSYTPEKKEAVVENLDLLQISFAPHYQANKRIALVLMADANEGTQSRHVLPNRHIDFC